jgi:2-oxoglutarate ferredoxin oxidoreductase subunit beta
MIAQALAHRGFSYLHILSPCVTFDEASKTYQNLGVQVRHLPADHDPTDLMAAMAQAIDTATPALGVLFRQPRPTLGDAMDEMVCAAGDKPSVQRAQVA